MSIIHVLSPRMRLVSLEAGWWALERLTESKRWTPVEIVDDETADSFVRSLFDGIGTKYHAMPYER